MLKTLPQLCHRNIRYFTLGVCGVLRPRPYSFLHRKQPWELENCPLDDPYEQCGSRKILSVCQLNCKYLQPCLFVITCSLLVSLSNPRPSPLELWLCAADFNPFNLFIGQAVTRDRCEVVTDPARTSTASENEEDGKPIIQHFGWKFAFKQGFQWRFTVCMSRALWLLYCTGVSVHSLLPEGELQHSNWLRQQYNTATNTILKLSISTNKLFITINNSS